MSLSSVATTQFLRESEVLSQKGLIMGKRLGQGNFSTVFIVTSSATAEVFAAKIVTLNNRSLRASSETRKKELLKREITILQSLRHPSIVQLRAVVFIPELQYVAPLRTSDLPEVTRPLTRTKSVTLTNSASKINLPEPSAPHRETCEKTMVAVEPRVVGEPVAHKMRSVILLTEFVEGETLFQRLLRGKAAQRLDSEYVSAMIFRQLMRAVAYLHKKQVVHRDIKPQNIMITEAKPRSASAATGVTSEQSFPVPRIKLVDFGLSKQIADAPARSIVGTPDWMAPEVNMALRQGTKHYDARVDCFSCGVVLHVMLTGEYPSASSLRKPTQPVPKNCRHSFQPRPALPASSKSFDGKDMLPPAVVSLVAGLLQRNPRDRLSAAQALEHPWLASLDARHSTENMHAEENRADAPLLPAKKKCAPSETVAPSSDTRLNVLGHGPKEAHHLQSLPTAAAHVCPIVGKLKLVHATQKHIASWFENALSTVEKGSPHYAVVRKGAVSCREQLHEVESLMQHIGVASHSAQETFPDLGEALRDHDHSRTRRLLAMYVTWVTRMQEQLRRHNEHFSSLIATINEMLLVQLDAASVPLALKLAQAASSAVEGAPHRRLRRADTLDRDESALLPLPGSRKAHTQSLASGAIAAHPSNARAVLVSTDQVLSDMRTVWINVGGMLQTLLYKTEHLKLLVPDSGADQAFGQRTNRRTKEYMEWWACMGRFSREFVEQFRHVRLHMYKFLKDS